MYDAKKIANYCVSKLDADSSDIKALGYVTLLRQYEQIGSNLK